MISENIFIKKAEESVDGKKITETVKKRYHEQYQNDRTTYELKEVIRNHLNSLQDEYKDTWLDYITLRFPKTDPAILIYLKNELEKEGKLN